MPVRGSASGKSPNNVRAWLGQNWQKIILAVDLDQCRHLSKACNQAAWMAMATVLTAQIAASRCGSVRPSLGSLHFPNYAPTTANHAE